MITVGVIPNGARYLSRNLRKNDYWSEGEQEVQGEWIGEAAGALGLAGAVDARAFEALRTKRAEIIAESSDGKRGQLANGRGVETEKALRMGISVPVGTVRYRLASALAATGRAEIGIEADEEI